MICIRNVAGNLNCRQIALACECAAFNSHLAITVIAGVIVPIVNDGRFIARYLAAIYVNCGSRSFLKHSNADALAGNFAAVHCER